MADEVVNLSGDQISSGHSIITQLADGQAQVVMTGVLTPTLKGDADWKKRTLRATIPIGSLTAGQTFSATQFAPSVSLASIDSDAPTSNAGWAIDGFALVNPNEAADHVTLDVQTAVRDPSNFLLRMTYQITLVGTVT